MRKLCLMFLVVAVLTGCAKRENLMVVQVVSVQKHPARNHSETIVQGSDRRRYVIYSVAGEPGEEFVADENALTPVESR